MGINVESKSEVLAERDEFLTAKAVREWLALVPDGATLSQITRDFGNQRDPDIRLVGLRAKWSDVRHGG